MGKAWVRGAETISGSTRESTIPRTARHDRHFHFRFVHLRAVAPEPRARDVRAHMILFHAGTLAPHDVWGAWSFEPGFVVPLLATAAVYTRGARETIRRS